MLYSPFQNHTEGRDQFPKGRENHSCLLHYSATWLSGTQAHLCNLSSWEAEAWATGCYAKYLSKSSFLQGGVPAQDLEVPDYRRSKGKVPASQSNHNSNHSLVPDWLAHTLLSISIFLNIILLLLMQSKCSCPLPKVISKSWLRTAASSQHPDSPCDANSSHSSQAVARWDIQSPPSPTHCTVDCWDANSTQNSIPLLIAPFVSLIYGCHHILWSRRTRPPWTDGEMSSSGSVCWENLVYLAPFPLPFWPLSIFWACVSHLPACLNIHFPICSLIFPIGANLRLSCPLGFVSSCQGKQCRRLNKRRRAEHWDFPSYTPQSSCDVPFFFFLRSSAPGWCC